MATPQKVGRVKAKEDHNQVLAGMTGTLQSVTWVSLGEGDASVNWDWLPNPPHQTGTPQPKIDGTIPYKKLAGLPPNEDPLCVG